MSWNVFLTFSVSDISENCSLTHSRRNVGFLTRKLSIDAFNQWIKQKIILTDIASLYYPHNQPLILIDRGHLTYHVIKCPRNRLGSEYRYAAFARPSSHWARNNEEYTQTTYMKKPHSSCVGCHWKQVFSMGPSKFWANFLSYVKFPGISWSHLALSPDLKKDHYDSPDCTRFEEDVSCSDRRGHRECARVDYLYCATVQLCRCDLRKCERKRVLDQSIRADWQGRVSIGWGS